MDEMVCFYCLTDENTRVPAITRVDGDAVCAKCAGEVRQMQLERQQRMEEISARFPRPPGLRP